MMKIAGQETSFSGVFDTIGLDDRHRWVGQEGKAEREFFGELLGVVELVDANRGNLGTKLFEFALAILELSELRSGSAVTTRLDRK